MPVASLQKQYEGVGQDHQCRCGAVAITAIWRRGFAADLLQVQQGKEFRASVGCSRRRSVRR